MKTVIKYPGSKWNTSRWIISKFPYDYQNMTYLEPFFGSGAIFFTKERSVIETINDIDKNVINLFRVIRENPEEFNRQVEFTPWSRDEYKLSYESCDCEMEKARRFMVRMWQAIGGKTSDISGWSNSIKPTWNGKSSWSRLNNTINKVSKRLSHSGKYTVQIENMDAIKLIERYDRKSTFLYLDPPYLLSTRNKRIYAKEYTVEDHINLLNSIKDYKGKVIISGYDSPLYDEYLVDWNKYKRKTNTEMGGKATEVIWLNYEPPKEQLKLW